MEVNFTQEELIEIRSTLQNEFVFKNYISILRNPTYILNFLLLLTRYPRGIIKGAGKVIKSKRFDDVVYAILEEYRSKKRFESM